MSHHGSWQPAHRCAHDCRVDHSRDRRRHRFHRRPRAECLHCSVFTPSEAELQRRAYEELRTLYMEGI